jgi:hypothetical protein
MIEDRNAAKVSLALTKALGQRKELLPYLRRIILDSFKEELNKVTEDEVDRILEAYEQTKRSREMEEGES